jgi:pre-mRNA-splicing helicase BRR2
MQINTDINLRCSQLPHLEQIRAEQFNAVVNIGKRITDFASGSGDTDAQGDGGSDEETGAMDEDMGVAVVFDEEEDEVQESDVDEVRDSEDEEDGLLGAAETTREERQLKGQDDGGMEEEEQVRETRRLSGTCMRH